MDTIIPDPVAIDMYLAIIQPASYLEFSRPVPFSDDGDPVEKGLLNQKGSLSGRAQAAVRPISDVDFYHIVSRGIDEYDLVLPRDSSVPKNRGFAEEQAPFDFGTEQERTLQFVSRTVRDRVFRRIVLCAYDERCAFTGLKFINGGGRAEVVAAHIRPVAENGPDTIHNGIALSSTAHWMFDRGLISLSDDLRILISRQVNDPESVRSFINANGLALQPSSPREVPHPRYLSWHREYCFKP